MKPILAVIACYLYLSVTAQKINHSIIWPLGIDSAYGIKEHFVYGLVQANNGHILAFAEGRIATGDDDPHHIVLKRSTDKGQTWLPSQIIIKSEGSASYANPTPVLDRKNGTLFLFYAQNFMNDSTKVYYITSKDHGISWSAATEITRLFDNDSLKRPFHLPGPGHGIMLENGRMVLQVWHRHAIKKPMKERKYGASVIFSDDYGKNWKSGGYIPGVDSFSANESRLAAIKGSHIMIDARMSNTASFVHRVQSVSTDGGITWSWPVYSSMKQFTTVDAGLASFKRKNKLHLIYTRPLGPGRNDLAVSYSTDNAKSWSDPRMIFKGPANYSDIIVLKDGTFLVLYGRGKPRYAAVARFDWKWLTNKNTNN